VNWDELGISGKYTVRDLWDRKDIGSFRNNFKYKTNPHACGFYKLCKKIILKNE